MRNAELSYTADNFVPPLKIAVNLHTYVQEKRQQFFLLPGNYPCPKRYERHALFPSRQSLYAPYFAKATVRRKEDLAQRDKR